MIKPNFFIVGAAKAGTTSLYSYLDKHPNVFMSPIKEPHYFSKDIRCKYFGDIYKSNVCFDIKNYLSNEKLEKRHIAFIEERSDYLQLFKESYNEKCIGEISNGYLYSKIAAKEIYDFNPNAKIIIVLRDPVERAFSHWLMDLRGDDVCRKSFLDAINEDQNNKEKGWGKSHLYIELGMYYEQIKRYLDVFPQEQILILLFDDLKNDQENFFSKLFTFLEIEHIPIDTNKKQNVASIPKFPMLNSIIRKLKLNKLVLSSSLKKYFKSILTNTDSLPELTLEDRLSMRSYFQEDLNKLQNLIDNDISKWMNMTKA